MWFYHVCVQFFQKISVSLIIIRLSISYTIYALFNADFICFFQSYFDKTIISRSLSDSFVSRILHLKYWYSEKPRYSNAIWDTKSVLLNRIWNLIEFFRLVLPLYGNLKLSLLSRFVTKWSFTISRFVCTLFPNLIWKNLPLCTWQHSTSSSLNKSGSWSIKNRYWSPDTMKFKFPVVDLTLKHFFIESK